VVTAAQRQTMEVALLQGRAMQSSRVFWGCYPADWIECDTAELKRLAVAMRRQQNPGALPTAASGSGSFFRFST